MKKPWILLVFLTGMYAAQAQSVGIGTAVPDNKAVLDIVSTNKGVLLPRITDTVNVTNPLEGMVIYNKKTKTPYYYNGKRWLSMIGAVAGSTSSSTDSLTYMITGTGFTASELPAVALAQGVTNLGIIGGTGSQSKPTFTDFNFTKIPDINSKPFNQAAVKWVVPAAIEFKFYAAGAATPYISYRLKNIMLSSFKTSAGAGDATFIESISFKFDNYGFKDWVTGANFNFNVTTGVVTAY